jgi:hypothetical protein
MPNRIGRGFAVNCFVLYRIVKETPGHYNSFFRKMFQQKITGQGKQACQQNSQ